MSTDTIFRSDARLPAIAGGRRTKAFWTAVVVAIEIIVIALCAYGAFLAYNALAYGVIPHETDYAWASVAVAAVYVVICIADNQYDLLGPEWNEHRPRGEVRQLAWPSCFS